MLYPVYTIQPVVKPLDNRLYRVYKHLTGCQMLNVKFNLTDLFIQVC